MLGVTLGNPCYKTKVGKNSAGQVGASLREALNGLVGEGDSLGGHGVDPAEAGPMTGPRLRRNESTGPKPSGRVSGDNRPASAARG